MRIPDSIISDISNRLNIVDIIGDYVSLSPSGRSYKGLCPFHSEKTPSFIVTPDKNLYHCFGCGKGGTIFTFIMEIENLSFIEAVNLLAKKAGIEINLTEDNETNKKRKAIEELYQRAAESFHYILQNSKSGKTAREYLKERGINKETICLYRIGYAPKDIYWLYRFLKKKEYSDEFLKDSGLFSSNYPRISLFNNRIMFPIRNIQGNVIAFGGRTISERGPKYINSPETILFKKKNILFGLYEALSHIKEKKEFIIVEGYMDVILLSQAGIKNCIAPLGTALTQEQVYSLKRYVNNGILLFDGDKAGTEAAKKAAITCEKAGIKCYIAKLENEKDPADIIKIEGAEALKNILKCTINSFEYLVKDSIEKYNLKGPEGKEAIEKDVFTFIEIIDSEIRKEEYIKQLADILNVEYISVKTDFLSRHKKQEKRNIKINNSEKNEISPDLFIMIAVIVNREHFQFLRNNLVPEDFEDLNGKKIFLALEECYREKEESLESFFCRLNDDKLKNIIIKKMSSKEFRINQDKLIKDSFIYVKHRSLKKQRKKIENILKKINGSELNSDKEKILLSDKMYLDEELDKLRMIGNDGSGN